MRPGPLGLPPRGTGFDSRPPGTLVPSKPLTHACSTRCLQNSFAPLPFLPNLLLLQALFTTLIVIVMVGGSAGVLFLLNTILAQTSEWLFYN